MSPETPSTISACGSNRTEMFSRQLQTVLDRILDEMATREISPLQRIFNEMASREISPHKRILDKMAKGVSKMISGMDGTSNECISAGKITLDVRSDAFWEKYSYEDMVQQFRCRSEFELLILDRTELANATTFTSSLPATAIELARSTNILSNSSPNVSAYNVIGNAISAGFHPTYSLPQGSFGVGPRRLSEDDLDPAFFKSLKPWLEPHKTPKALCCRLPNFSNPFRLTRGLSPHSVLAVPFWFGTVAAEDHGKGCNSRDDGLKICGLPVYMIVIAGITYVMYRRATLAGQQRGAQEESVYHHGLVIASGVICLHAFTTPGTSTQVIVFFVVIVLGTLIIDRIHKFRTGFRGNESRHLLFELVCTIVSASILNPRSDLNFGQTLLLTSCAVTCIYEYLRRRWQEAGEIPQLIPN